MITVFLVVLGIVSFALLDALKKQRLPNLYMEPLDVTYGLDRDLTPRKVLTRFGFPFVAGLLLGIMARVLNAEAHPSWIAGAATGVGSLMLVYPFLAGRLPPPRYAVDRRTAAIITYVLFVFLNASLGYFGSALGQSIFDIVRGPQIAQAVREWARQNLVNVLLSTLFTLSFTGLWRIGARRL